MAHSAQGCAKRTASCSSIPAKRAKVASEVVVVESLDPMGPYKFGACTGLSYGDARRRGDAISRMAECLLRFGSMLYHPRLVFILKPGVLSCVRAEFEALKIDLSMLSWSSESVLFRSVATLGVGVHVYDGIVRKAASSIYDFLRKDVAAIRGVIAVLAADGVYWKAHVSAKILRPTSDGEPDFRLASYLRYFQVISADIGNVLGNVHLARIIEAGVLRRVRVEYDAMKCHLAVLMRSRFDDAEGALASLCSLGGFTKSLQFLHDLAGGGVYWSAHVAVRAGRDASAGPLCREGFQDGAFSLWLSQCDASSLFA